MGGAVVVVGSVNVDLVVRVARLPGPGETVIGGPFARSQGGKGANQAAAAARLGARTWLIGAVGDDEFGASARADLEQRGVELSYLRTGKLATGVAEILVDERGENLIGVASGANYEVEAAWVDEALRSIPAKDAVVLANLEVPEPAVLAAARGARASGFGFVLNPAPAGPLPAELIAACDVLTPNQHEMGALGVASGSRSGSGSVGDLLAAGARAVVVTRGAAGADLYRAGDAAPVHQPAFDVDVVDTTGAGDAFSAALAWALAEGRALEDCVRLAAATAALSTTALGARAALPDRAEVERLAGP